MASDWTTIDVAVTEGVNYVAMGADPAAHGVAEISGEASLYSVLLESDREPSRYKFKISLVIQGRSASEVKSEATVWPDVMNQLTDNDDVIGILFKPDEFELRRRGLSPRIETPHLAPYGATLSHRKSSLPDLANCDAQPG
jgi:hypothetical protein